VAILKILRISNRYDLCLLSGIRGLTPLKIASKSPKFGQRAFVLGHPYLSPQTLSIGRIRGKSVIEVGSIISGEQEYKDCKDSGGRIRNYVFFEACIYEQSALDTTIEIYPGNSGSPVVDSYGRLISVVFAGNSATNDGFLVPYEFLEDFLSGDLG
jgi:S1-C subfamily serine protease